MTNDERERRQHEAFLADMEKLGIKPVGRHSPPMPQPARRYDPYSELE